MTRTADSFEDGVYKLGSEQERWLVLPDMHIPVHDERTLDAILEYASSIKFDGILQLGDLMDFDLLSRWSQDNLRKLEGSRILKEYEAANKVLDQVEASVRRKNPEAKFVVLQGNHDWRVENTINRAPAFEGMIEMETNLGFDERNILFWKYWENKKPLKIGKAYFIHGEYLGTHHAKKTADNYGRSVFYGHTHSLQIHTRSSFDNDFIQCASLGTLSRLNLDYIGFKPTSWCQCFAEFFIRPDGNFNYFVTTVVDGGFTAMNGKYYGG